VTSVEQGDRVELSVSKLSPGTNYTLLIYAENSIGRSTAAFTVYAYTLGMKFRLSSHFCQANIRDSVVTVNQTDIDTAAFCCHRGVVVLAMF